MCGIAGFISLLSEDEAFATVKAMTDSISHRGPDDEGFWVGRSKNGNTVALGHRRLAIIDLNTGHQPIGNEDGSIQIVFNGEIYNYVELREELVRRGHRFATASDTETIVHAYEEYGHKCVEHLRGMFAFAIWDARQEVVFLARDRHGKKPLFYWQDGDHFLFASEIKAITTCPLVKKDLCESALWDYLVYRYVPGNSTLLQGIRKLSPGSFATFQYSRLQEQTYYTPPDLEPNDGKVFAKDPLPRFSELLDESVACRLVSDVPFGAFLSGGIDSSAIVGLMSRHCRVPVKTFSVGFAEAAYSELRYAREAAKLFGTEHHELTVTQSDLVEHLPRLVWFRDGPVAEPSDIPIFMLAREASRTVKMVLTGEGSDELLGGYPKHVYERFAGLYQALPKGLRRKIIMPMIMSLPYRYYRVKTALKALDLDGINERMPYWFGGLTSDERSRLATFSPSPPLIAPHWQNLPQSPRSRLRAILSFDQTSWLPDNLLERGDRMTMAASIEARMPFMDHLLWEFAASLPDRYRVRRLQTKWILRAAMKRILPEAILERPKVGFRVPVNEWFRGSLRDFLHDHLFGQRSLSRQILETSVLRGIFDDHLSGKQNHEKLLWSLLTLEIWFAQTKPSTVWR